MLVFETNRFGKRRTTDIHNLPIAGTMAHKLSGAELHAEMQKLGIAGIAETTGHQDLSLIYGNWLQEKSEAAA